MRIVFFGTPKFAAIILKEMVAKGVEPIVVVTNPDRPGKRSHQLQPSPVKQLWQHSLTCPIYQPDNIRDPRLDAVLDQAKADFFVTAAYGKILPKRILTMPKVAALNVHASILPQYRGANPIRKAIMEGEKVMGVTIMYMVEELDAGEIIAVEKIKIEADWDYGIVEEKLAFLGAKALFQVLALLLRGEVKKRAQDESKVSYAPKLQKADCALHFNQPAAKVHNQIRALSPEPGAFMTIFSQGQQKRVKLFKSRQIEMELPCKKLVVKKESLLIGCNPGAIEVLELQVEGKKRMDIQKYLKATPHNIKIL